MENLWIAAEIVKGLAIFYKLGYCGHGFKSFIWGMIWLRKNVLLLENPI